MSASRRGRVSSSEHTDSDGNIARKKERLDNTIFKLKGKVAGFSDDENTKSNITVVKNTRDEMEKISSVEIEDQNSSDEDRYSVTNFRIIPKDRILNSAYCMWENISNVCWLDASMSLLSHNLTLRYETDLEETSQTIEIIKYYNEAICTLNDEEQESIETRLKYAKRYLKFAQESSLRFLQPMLKNKEGDPESAFCSLINLIGKDEMVKKYFNVLFKKSLQCEKCGKKKSTHHTKPIITLPKVEAFQPSSPTFVTECPQFKCKAKDQRMHISYETLPKCLIFHFERGAGKGELQPLDFSKHGRDYKLTGLMTLEKAEDTSMNHFVTWIRDPNSDSWLECNDLNPDVLTFSVIPPHYLNLEDIYMVMFEAFDDKGTIEVKASQAGSEEKCNLEDEQNIEIIDLEDPDLEDSACTSEKTGGLTKKPVSGQKDSTVRDTSEELDFLNSIRNDTQESELASINIQQIEMLKQLDLKPKCINISNETINLPGEKISSIEILPSTDKVQDERNNFSLQDTLSPRYTSIILKLAKQNDEIERSNATSQRETVKDSNILQNNVTKGDKIFLPSPILGKTQLCEDKEIIGLSNYSLKPSVSAILNPENAQSAWELVETSLHNNSSNPLSEDDNINETKRLLESRHVKLSEIIASKKGDLITMNKESSNETNENRNVVNTESKLASFSDVQNEENISLRKISLDDSVVLQQIKVPEIKDIEPTVEEDTTTKLPTSTEIEDENEKDVCSLDNMEHNVFVEVEKSQMNFKLSEENLVNFSLTSTVDKLARRINKELKTSPKDTVIKKQQRNSRKTVNFKAIDIVTSKSTPESKTKSTETSDNQNNLETEAENLKVAEENIPPSLNYNKPTLRVRKSQGKEASFSMKKYPPRRTIKDTIQKSNFEKPAEVLSKNKINSKIHNSIKDSPEFILKESVSTFSSLDASVEKSNGINNEDIISTASEFALKKKGKNMFCAPQNIIRVALNSPVTRSKAKSQLSKVLTSKKSKAKNFDCSKVEKSPRQRRSLSELYKSVQKLESVEGKLSSNENVTKFAPKSLGRKRKVGIKLPDTLDAQNLLEEKVTVDASLKRGTRSSNITQAVVRLDRLMPEDILKYTFPSNMPVTETTVIKKVSPNKTLLNLFEPLEPNTSDNKMKSSESNVPNLTEKPELFTVVNSNSQAVDFFVSSVHMQEIIDKETDPEALDETDRKKKRRKLVDINSDSENLLSSAKKCLDVNNMLEAIHSPANSKLQSDSSNKMKTPMKGETSQLKRIISPKTLLSNEPKEKSPIKKAYENKIPKKLLNIDKMLETTNSATSFKLQSDSSNKMKTPSKDETSQLALIISPKTLAKTKEKSPVKEMCENKSSEKCSSVNKMLETIPSPACFKLQSDSSNKMNTPMKNETSQLTRIISPKTSNETVIQEKSPVKKVSECLNDNKVMETTHSPASYEVQSDSNNKLNTPMEDETSQLERMFSSNTQSSLFSNVAVPKEKSPVEKNDLVTDKVSVKDVDVDEIKFTLENVDEAVDCLVDYYFAHTCYFMGVCVKE